MILWLSHAQAAQIVAHARAHAPREACGLIGGRGVRAEQIVPIGNTAPDPERHFYMDERELTAALMRFERDGQTLIGIYHSHPGGTPIPSESDIKAAFYPRTAYLIVGLRGESAELGGWEIDAGRVERVELHISDDAPELDTAPSQAQKLAIILSAILAFAVMIVISLSLLPPAPELPTP